LSADALHVNFYLPFALQRPVILHFFTKVYILLAKRAQQKICPQPLRRHFTKLEEMVLLAQLVNLEIFQEVAQLAIACL
jgi:hypothetical protein